MGKDFSNGKQPKQEDFTDRRSTSEEYRDTQETAWPKGFVDWRDYPEASKRNQEMSKVLAKMLRLDEDGNEVGGEDKTLEDDMARHKQKIAPIEAMIDFFNSHKEAKDYADWGKNLQDLLDNHEYMTKQEQQKIVSDSKKFLISKGYELDEKNNTIVAKTLEAPKKSAEPKYQVDENQENIPNNSNKSLQNAKSLDAATFNKKIQNVLRSADDIAIELRKVSPPTIIAPAPRTGLRKNKPSIGR